MSVNPLERLVTWHTTANAEYPYAAFVGDKIWTIRINDFPDEMLYSLLIDAEESLSFNSWPASWVKPPQ